jgi:hypothetical protein
VRTFLAGTATASFIALALAACESDGGGSVSSGTGGGPSPDDSCSQYTSCGACTPVTGCGWCYNADGTGNCAASPDECTTWSSSFTWTWNPSGCYVAADAAVAPRSDGASGTDGELDVNRGDGAPSSDAAAEADAIAADVTAPDVTAADSPLEAMSPDAGP